MSINFSEVSNNKIGIDIHNAINPENNVEILDNEVNHNNVGINILNSENVNILDNIIAFNDTGVIGTSSKLLMNNNVLYSNRGPFSSIHLNNSYGSIRNNYITLDAGDAVKLENNSTADINYNNIYNNAGFGINNTNPSIITNAQNNWWGDSKGPGGEGSGSGNPVSAGVNYSDWMKEILSVTVAAPADTFFSPPNHTDSVNIYFNNFLNFNDTLYLSLSDDFNWFKSSASSSVYLDSAFGITKSFSFEVPSSAAPGTINRTIINVISKSNTSHSQTDTFYIKIYQPAIKNIFVYPDTVTISPGDSVQFYANGYDQHNKELSFAPQWSASGGIINNNGWFFAGTQAGSFEITVTDPASQLEKHALVIVSATVGVKDKLTTIPTEYNLYQNYPNPFNPTTTIRYSIPFTSNVGIKIYNILGQQVANLVNKIHSPGVYEFNWNASKLASGIYIYLVEAKSMDGKQSYRNIKKMVLLK
jgi:plastocyanin